MHLPVKPLFKTKDAYISIQSYIIMNRKCNQLFTVPKFFNENLFAHFRVMHLTDQSTNNKPAWAKI